MNKYFCVLFITGMCLLAQASRAQVYDITDYGALGDSITSNTKAIQTAINKCSIKGGSVNIPKGVYLTGTIYLKSNVEIHLEKGAKLKGSPKFADYPINNVIYPNAFTTEVDGKVIMSRALIFAEGLHDIALTGEGTIDGNGGSGEFQLGNDGSSKDSKQRPCVVLMINCRNILVEGLHLKNSAYWMQNYIGCDSLHIIGIDVYNHANYNEDGIDIDARNVLIEDSHFDSDDDGICFKSHERKHICENIVVRNCSISSNCNAIKFGTVSMGGFKNVKIYNCNITPCKTDKIRRWQESLKFIGLPITVISGIALESVDGANIENITISDIRMRGVQTPIFIVLGRKGRRVVGSHDRSPIGSIKNVLIENVRAESYSKMASSLTGLPGYYIEDVILKNITIVGMGGGTKAEREIILPENSEAYPENRMFGDVYPASGFFIRHARDITFKNVILKLKNKDCRYNIIVDDVQNFKPSKLKMDKPSCNTKSIKGGNI